MGGKYSKSLIDTSFLIYTLDFLKSFLGHMIEIHEDSTNSM